MPDDPAELLPDAPEPLRSVVFLEVLVKELRFAVNGLAEGGAPCNLNLTFHGLKTSKILSVVNRRSAPVSRATRAAR